MEWLQYIQDHAEELENLSAQEIAFIAVCYGGSVAAALFAARTVVTYLGRKTGCSHPDHWHRWPRVPWRAPYRAWQAVVNWHERVFHIGKISTGGFASFLSTLALLYTPGRVLLGRATGFGFGLLQPIGIEVKRHLFYYAMTGANKTTSLISLVSTWRNSAMVIDPKGQITGALAHHDLRNWHVLDPYGISDCDSMSLNPIDIIKQAIDKYGEEAGVLWALRIADALVKTPDGSRTPFFTDVSRGLLAGLLLHIISWHEPHLHHLPFARDLILHGYPNTDDRGNVVTTPIEAFQLLLRFMQQNGAFDGFVSGSAAAFMSASGETGGNVLSTLRDQSKWLDIPQVRRVLLKSTFDIRKLKTGESDVLAFVASVSSIREELSPLARLLTNMTAYIFQDEKRKNGQCLYIIDELPSQGYNETLEVMLAVLRSYGLTMVGVAVNVEMMKRHYPKSWKSFSGEADAVMWSGGNHPDSAEHLSQLLGKKTIIETDRATGHKTRREIPVMESEQIKRYLDPNSDRLIVTRAGARPLKLKSEPYFKALPVWKYTPDRDFKEAFLRRIYRFLFARNTAARHQTVSEEALADANISETDSESVPQDENIINFPRPRINHSKNKEEKYRS